MKTRHVRRAAAATELAILLPFLGLAFAVALDFCRTYYVTQALQASAQAGALYASGSAYAPAGTAPDQAAKDAAVAVAASLQPPLDPNNISVTFTSGTATVSVTYAVPLLTQVLNGAQSVTVTRSVTMNLAP
jgi:hypothetical protein